MNNIGKRLYLEYISRGACVQNSGYLSRAITVLVHVPLALQFMVVSVHGMLVEFLRINPHGSGI